MGKRLALTFLVALPATMVILGSTLVGAQEVPCEPGAVTDVCPSPSPSPSPTPPPSPTPDPDPTDPPQPSPSPDQDGGASDRPGDYGPDGRRGPHRPHHKKKRPPPGTCTIEGVTATFGGYNDTGKLMSLVAELARYGVPAQRGLLQVVGPFPVAGLSSWSDDWHALRCVPDPHLHKGLDMFAPAGTPVVAAADGYVSQKIAGEVSGLSVEVTDSRGVQYFYAHLSAFAAGLSQGQRVEVGQVLGYVGDTGNARGGTPHLHFEVQPGGVPVPPKPYVDSWLNVAVSRARKLLREERHVAADFRLTRTFDLSGQGRPARLSADGAIGITLLQPAVSSQAVVHRLLRQIAFAIDWSSDDPAEPRRQEPRKEEDAVASLVDQLLGPVAVAS